MNIQSISIVVPTKGCVNKCKFCVSRMHESPYESSFSTTQIKKRIRMKTKREELIGLVKWWRENYFNHYGFNNGMVVDEYLNSINSNAPTESRNVSTDVYFGKVCKWCKSTKTHYDYVNIEGVDIWRCDDCLQEFL